MLFEAVGAASVMIGEDVYPEPFVEMLIAAILPEALIQYRIHKNQTNRDEKRFEIQKNSATKVVLMKPKNRIDRLFLTDVFKQNYLSSYDAFNPNIFLRTYLKIRKRLLNVKNHSLNLLISKN